MAPPEAATRKSRIVYDFPVKTLEKYSCHRQDEAATMLGVAPITLKRICQRHNYRWPYRTLKARARREARLRAEQAQSTTNQIKVKKAQSVEINATRSHASPSLKPRQQQQQQLPSAHLLLMLRHHKEDARSLASLKSPTAMEMDEDGHQRQPGLSSPPSGRALLAAQFPLTTESTLQRVHLEPHFSLTQLLSQQQQPLAPPASPPLSLQGACAHHTNPSVEPKNAVFCSKMGFPNGKFSSLTESTRLQAGCKLPSADFLLSRFPHSQYNARA